MPSRWSLLIPHVLRRLAVVLPLAGCGGETARPVPEAQPTAAAAADPPPRGDAQDVPAVQNINKLVIGGDNRDPQMGLFAMEPAEAKAVLAIMKQGYKPAYDLALASATKAWAGPRNYCSDAVRIKLQFLGIDGMLDRADWARWRKASYAKLAAQHLREINALHDEMMGETNPAGCEASLRTYVEALTFAATNKLELLNFGF